MLEKASLYSDKNNKEFADHHKNIKHMAFTINTLELYVVTNYILIKNV